ncbi:MAG TPA: protein translocase subunit SecD [Ruminiclostridium sp.]|jgi:preprotein translocase subunit SecD|uniref:Protein translocase subunit SecD n=1 Tax=Acetivibrio saccincola TaxID=1677857 RepID=A0A2S8RD18_9FIRM|nr:protein translocase subunit SecD [Acetivibrio saccincola]HAA42431.1 protein translocase subunit SecD [Ruminiclostridium sp.]NLW25832.1 protein translocase subunit SecD [Acetivibrio saccincola]PQQ67683.1 protein translocase subunit SecD [Acetivibrio saccincola]HOA97025.1 protein translocase subunit SecD [Acetivibrio saccincola]HQD28052.1 protein translocase subunit SecD [Acetivibrio saccincola]
MKAGDRVKSALIVLIIGLLTYTAIMGISIPGIDFEIKKVKDSIRFGIDIRGGVRTTLVPPEGVTPTADQMDTIVRIIELRLDNKQILDRSVIPEKSSGRVIVEIPWRRGETTFDPYEALAELGDTALLTFQEVDPSLINEETGEYLPTGKIIIQGDDVVEARPALGQDGRMDVALKLTGEAGRKFQEATERLIGQPIAIFLDDQFISAPVVQSAIPAGSEPRITLGGFREDTVKEASRLAGLISAGALPFSLESGEVRLITPELGAGALDVSVKAGLIALILIWLFMILVYRIPGVSSSITLLGQIVLLLLVVAISNIPLTISGIGGIILTMGMSVDANVIIFERIKEELKTGKTIQGAIDIGFKRAITAVIDGNITTLIAAVVLYVLGTGSVKSFAFTLGVGVVLNFITAVFITKILLRTAASLGPKKSHWLYGVKGGTSNV